MEIAGIPQVWQMVTQARSVEVTCSRNGSADKLFEFANYLARVPPNQLCQPQTPVCSPGPEYSDSAGKIQLTDYSPEVAIESKVVSLTRADY